MSTDTNRRTGSLSRRRLLERAATAAGAAMAILLPSDPTAAAPKISKAAVAYQDHPDGDKRCGKCMQFQPPNSCKLVDGTVTPQGYCRVFTPLRQAEGRVLAASATG